MAHPQPQELANDIVERLNAIAHKGGDRVNVGSFEFRGLMRDITRLQDINAVVASRMKAQAYAIAGDRSQALYWADNTEKLADKGFADYVRFTSLILLGYPSEASELFDSAFENRGDTTIDNIVGKCCSFAWFERAVKVLDYCVETNLVHKATGLMEVARRAEKIFQERGMSLDATNAVMDEAFGLMRDVGTLWHGRCPLITIVDDDGGDAYVSLRFPLLVDASKAAELSWQLIERLIEKNLDQTALSVSFTPVVEIEQEPEGSVVELA
jgi:hypothetical protein